MSDLISREFLQTAIHNFFYGLNHTPTEEDIQRYIEVAPSVEIKGEWIPVSERLPLFLNTCKISDDVLITNGYEIDMGYLVERKGKIFWHYYGSELEVGIKDEDNDATAWMPLPEPYKAEKTETCKGCLEPCIMYEPDMRACKKKVTKR